MGKKKDCFGVEDYVCMTPNCPYVRDCINDVWKKRMARAIGRGKTPPPPAKHRSPGRRLSVKS